MTIESHVTTPLDVLITHVRACAHYNQKSEAPPAAILWTDKECQWQSAMGVIKQHLPELIELGSYNPAERIGPSVWIKCAIARKVADLPEGLTPIIYLPGIARKELRAIELCPDELKPLAELQYRGFWWATPNNNRDWTVSGFLSNKTIGLELDIGKDEKTQTALLSVLPFLLEERADKLQGRRLVATDFNQLVADDPIRDLLQWMNDPTIIDSWDKAHAEIFAQHCQDQLGISPTAQNRVRCAQELCERNGNWSDVWNRFEQMAHRLPHLIELLKNVNPQGLALEPSSYLSVNAADEQQLAQDLTALTGLPDSEVRDKLKQLAQQHENRRTWLWYGLGLSPYLEMLLALNKVEEYTQFAFSGPDVATMAQAYQKQHWQADGAAIDAMAKANDDNQRKIVADTLAIIYTPWLTRVAENFQRLVQEFGYPGAYGQKINEAHSVYQVNSQIVFFVDGLRFDIAQKFMLRLQDKSDISAVLQTNWAALPSLTATAKAAVTPVHDLLTGALSADDFIPMQAQTEQAFSSHFLKKLLSDRDWQYLEGVETGDPSGRAWVQTGDIDNTGHAEQLRLPNRIDDILQEIEARIDGLLAAGWKHIRVVTDHGWLWVPDKLPKAELPKNVTTNLNRRCAILKSNVATERLSQPWYWNDNVRVAMAPGISGFVAGDYYNHGGLSLQECLTPVINIHAQS